MVAITDAAASVPPDGPALPSSIVVDASRVTVSRLPHVDTVLEQAEQWRQRAAGSRQRAQLPEVPEFLSSSDVPPR